MIVWSALRTACYSIYLLSLAWLIIYAYGNVRGGGKTNKRWEEKWQMCIRCAHTQRLFAFYATLCETYYGLVTHVYIHPIHPTPLWQANISKQLHKCALECAFESNRKSSSSRRKELNEKEGLRRGRSRRNTMWLSTKLDCDSEPKKSIKRWYKMHAISRCERHKQSK